MPAQTGDDRLVPPTWIQASGGVKSPGIVDGDARIGVGNGRDVRNRASVRARRAGPFARVARSKCC